MFGCLFVGCSGIYDDARRLQECVKIFLPEINKRTKVLEECERCFIIFVHSGITLQHYKMLQNTAIIQQVFVVVYKPSHLTWGSLYLSKKYYSMFGADVTDDSAGLL